LSEFYITCIGGNCAAILDALVSICINNSFFLPDIVLIVGADEIEGFPEG
jgi:hypothetical protein